MQYFYAKKDLESFSQRDLDLLATFYDISTDNKNDLLWILAITILTMSQYAKMPPKLPSVKELLEKKATLNWEWIKGPGRNHWLATSWEILHKCDPQYVETSCDITTASIRWALDISSDPEWRLLSIEDEALGFKQILKKYPIIQVTFGREESGWKSAEHTLVVIGDAVLQSYYKKYPLRLFKITPEFIKAVNAPNTAINYELITGVCCKAIPNLRPFYWVPVKEELFKHAEMPPDKAWEKYGTRLTMKFASDPSAPQETTTLPVEMINADPTPSKKYLEWIITSYLDGGIKRFEDMERTKIALQEYAFLLKKKLITNKFEQNIGAFCGLGGCVQGRKKIEKEGLDTYLDRYKEALAKMRKVAEVRISEQDVKKIYEDSDLLIVSPLTQATSCKYGAGTKWCTAATRGENLFKEYTRSGPLYILIPKKPKHGGEKYQVHIEREQYMDELDNQLKYEDLRKRFPVLKNIPEFINLEIIDQLKKGQLDPKLLENITMLNLTYAHIGNEGAESLAKAIENNDTLTTLILDSNWIEPQGAKSLAEALEVNNTLITLSLRDNYIYDKGVQYIAKALYTNSTLITLNLENNRFANVGVESIAMALERNNTLINLNLAWNMIDDIGANKLAEAFDKNDTLKELYLCGNKISSDGANIMMEKNKTITKLQLMGQRT